MKLLAMSGSLRAASTNTALLRAAQRLAPAGLTIALYDGLGTLPVFNPDDDTLPAPPAVQDLRDRLTACDGILIASPEYAHGVPGGLKNALDWVVASGELVDKPAALLHASPRSDISRRALAEILHTMSALPVDAAEATVPLLGLDPAAMVQRLAEPAHAATIRTALTAFADAIRRHRGADAARGSDG
jgi:NAD(P)H-dependent FMN reductase